MLLSSGGTYVPTADAVTSAQPLLHVSRACRDPFHGEPASRRSTSGPYLLSSHLRPRRAGSRGPASVVVSHGPAARPTGLFPVPLRHDRLRSTGENNFLSIGVSPVTLACFPVASSRVVSDRFLSTGVRPVRLALLRAGRSRLTCGRPCRLVSGPFLWAGSRPGAHAEALRFTPTRQGEHTVMLVLAYDRRMETTVYATAAVAGRPQVSHFSGRPSMLPPPGS